MEKSGLSERDICTKCITPALQQAGWDIQTQIREEVTFTDGRVIVRGQSTSRGKKKRADYLLFYKPDIPIAVVEAKDNSHSVGDGMQQALAYSHADCLDVPFAISSNAWREILEYFHAATQIGMTATPKETEYVSNIDYFGKPVYTYSLRQGIDDGFLAPYKVVRIDFDKDLQGWRPKKGQADHLGQTIEDRIYNQRDFDRTLVLDRRTQLVAKKVTEFLQGTNQYDKTIVFCEDIDHAERMRQALINCNPDLASEDDRYVVRITGDNPEGKAQLDFFIDPESR